MYQFFVGNSERVFFKKQQPGDQLKGGAFSTGCCSVFDQ